MKCCKLNPFIKVLNINPKISRSFFGMYNNNGIVWKPIGNRQRHLNWRDASNNFDPFEEKIGDR